MMRRFRPQQEKSNGKASKKFRHEPQSTSFEEDEREEAGDLRKFIKNEKMIEILNKNGVKSLFPIQYRTFNSIYEGKDLKGKDKTGSGKTLAFSLPVIERLRKDNILRSSKNPKFLIVLPTRELVIQVVANISNLKLRQGQFQVVGVYGGESVSIQSSKIKGGVDIIAATPGRLLDMIDRHIIELADLRVVCLDEADQMLKQGFKEDIQKLFEMIKVQKKGKNFKTQNLLFSATFPQWIQSISQKYLTNDCATIDLANNEQGMAKNIKHYLIELKSDQQVPNAVQKAIQRFSGNNCRTIVFCETKRQVRNLVDQLRVKTAELHGDVKQQQRSRIYQDFKSGKITTIVATNVAARGLDFPDIQLVVQTSPPREVQSFVHRSGRTGRAGKSGVNILLYTRKSSNQVDLIRRISKATFETAQVSDLSKSQR